ncbi:MAG: nucleotidyltransferase domain-containing protein [Betaproteobacteria bacterium]|nr:nucleotidyltransferase domain-containing protein [Betaproteobacteria bacterium]
MGFPKIAISPSEWAIIKNILERHVPQHEVWAFGSRAKWTSKEYSDLDLTIITDKPLSLATSAALTDDFSESDLPYKVDVVDWATTSESFRKIIERDKVVVQKRSKSTVSPVLTFNDMAAISTKPLRTYVSLQRGTTYKGNLVGLPGPVLLGLASIGANGGFRHGGFKTYGGDCPEKISLKSGDVYVSLKDVTQSGDLLGSIARVPDDIESGRLTQDTAKLVFDGEPIPREYLYWLLRTPYYRDYCRGCATGTTTLGLARDDFLNFQIPDAGPRELNIVDLLEGTEKRITLLRETNATLEAIAQALFKSWFVDFDPVRAKAEGREPESIPPEIAALFPSELEDSPLGEIPKGWRVGGLGVISRNLRIGAKHEDLTDDTAYIGLEHMPRQSIALDSWEGASKVESGKSRFRRGQILFGKLRPYFHKVGIAPIDGVCSTDILVIEATSSAWHSLCLCLFSSKSLVDHATQLSNGAKMPRTNWHDLANYQIKIPPVNIAQKFDDIVSSLLDRIIANVHQAKELTEVRDAILPKLMSGVLHMPVEEATS